MSEARHRHPLLSPFAPLVAMLGEALGAEYEIILHDLTEEPPRIIASANERLSGRTKDSPMSDFGRFLMTSREADGLDYIANYPAEAANGSQMRSSVLLIRDDALKLVGMLCINYDTTKAKILLDAASFLTAVRPLSFKGVRGEKFGGPDDGSALLAEARRYMRCPLEYMTGRERRECVAYLDGRGFFKLKGSIDSLAKETRKSRFTLYADLRAVRKRLAGTDGGCGK